MPAYEPTDDAKENDQPKLTLAPAAELASKNGVRFPNESPGYRRARDALLAEKIELRRYIERVAEQRRALPAGGEVTKDYRFRGESGPVELADLFGDKQTLAVYSYMFGPKRERPCPMCTSLLSAWDGEARNVEQRIALVVVARSPIERLVAFKNERGRGNLKLSTCSCAATAGFATAGASRRACRPPTRAKTRAVRSP